jgi:RNA polymerase primary sigma factor
MGRSLSPLADRSYTQHSKPLSQEDVSMPVADLQDFELSSSVLLSRPDVQVLGADAERELLLELDECKKLLIEGYCRIQPVAPPRSGNDLDIQNVVRDLLNMAPPRGAEVQTLRSIAIRYRGCRTRLAMANLRLVAHMAKRYRNRGLSTPDLIQEGFCGLLTAIDRFDPTKRTRLASYAVWWIRQSLQRAVAAGAYPVRLNPRHLRRLAAHSPLPDHSGSTARQSRPSVAAANTIRQILSATRPAISLNTAVRSEEGSCLLDALTYPAHDDAETFGLNEYVEAMIQQLKPREQVVLRLRFGLNGKECLSLSQVSQVLDVSKERIRQIQDEALQKLRSLAPTKPPCEVTGKQERAAQNSGGQGGIWPVLPYSFGGTAPPS